MLPKSINEPADKNIDTQLKVAEVHGLRVKKDIKKFSHDVDVILIGTIKSISEPKQNKPGASMIYSTITVQVYEYLKNPQPTKELTIKSLGGRIGNTVLVAEDAPQFTAGEKVLLFLGFDYKKELVVYAGDYGKFSLEGDVAIGSEKEKIKVNDLVKEIKKNIKK